MKLLLLGATGLVGSHVLDLAIADERIDEVVAPVRRPLAGRPGLTAPEVDFERLPADAAWWQADAAICALGTTMKKAGSREAFRRVDHGYALQAARLAAEHDIRIFSIGIGADTQPSTSAFSFAGLQSDPSIELDEESLRQIAELTGGEYFRARNAEDMLAIYQRLDQLEPALRAGLPDRHATPLYPWPLGLALLLSLALSARVVQRGRHHV